VTVNAGGKAQLFQGALEDGVAIGYNGYDDLEYGATGSSIVVQAGGLVQNRVGASVNGIVISSGAVFQEWQETSGSGWISGGVSGLNILPGGAEAFAYIINQGRTVNGLHLSQQGFVEVDGGVIVSTTLAGTAKGEAGSTFAGNAAMSEIDYGVAIATVINSGADQVVFDVVSSQESVASRTAIKSGGEQFVFSGGVASASLISKGGMEFIYSGGASLAADVLAGGTEFVYSGASASGVTVAKGGRLVDGGVLVGAVVSSGATLVLVSGVVENGFTVSAAVASVATTISGAALAAGAVVDLFDEVALGGGVVVDSGALASGTTVGADGVERVRAHGVASATTVTAGGMMTVSSGAVAAGGTIGSGGIDVLIKGGKESAITVSSGGILELATPIHSGSHILPPGVVTSTEVVSGVTLLSGAILQALPVGGVAALAQAMAAHAPAEQGHLATPSHAEARPPLLDTPIGFSTSARG
jgi:autotransporter passenger strand-loop-strand repeat protein